MSRAGQTSAKPKEGNSGDHPWIKLSTIGLSLCGDSRRASIHRRDEGEPVPVTQAARRPIAVSNQDSGGLKDRQRARQSPTEVSDVSSHQRARAQISMGQAGARAKEDWKVKRCQSHTAPPSRGGSRLDGWMAVSHLLHCSPAENRQPPAQQINRPTGSRKGTTWPSPIIGLVH